MRRKKSKLNFASERQTRAKRLRAFVISFVAFILVSRIYAIGLTESA